MDSDEGVVPMGKEDKRVEIMGGAFDGETDAEGLVAFSTAEVMRTGKRDEEDRPCRERQGSGRRCK